MTRFTINSNCSDPELTLALHSLAAMQGFSLHKSAPAHSRETAPEHWMREAASAWNAAGAARDTQMIGNVERLLGHWALGIRGTRNEDDGSDTLHKAAPFKGRRKQRPLYLSQGQIDELILLIRTHYRINIRGGASWTIPLHLQSRWRALGILDTDTSLDAVLDDAFVGGRLAHIITDNATIAQMRIEAAKRPMPRVSALIQQAAAERIAFDLSEGVGARAVQIAGRLALDVQNTMTRDLVSDYRANKLHATPTNRAGIPATDLDSTAGRRVSGWQGLGRELRNRFAADDRARDWERVGASALRQTQTIGAVAGMLESGVEYCYWDVQPNACATCKRTYRDEQGKPRRFAVDAIWDRIATSGGANYDGVVGPNALLHPWCQCRVQRVIDGVAPLSRTLDRS